MWDKTPKAESVKSNIFFKELEASQIIHYAWIGPPTYQDERAVPGHDIDGPIQLAQKLQSQGTRVNTIKFWCIKEHQDFYRSEFLKAKVDIQVCAIEDLVKHELKGNLAEAAQQFKAYMEKVNFPKLTTVMKRVEFKDGFSLFLLLTQSGYFLDTNILPLRNRKLLDFSGEKQFTTSGLREWHRDFFLMYSPVVKDPTAMQVFKKWIESPSFANLDVFKDFNIPLISNVTGSKYERLGVEKISYRSYGDRIELGHFYWVHPDRVDCFLQKRVFADINRQSQSPNLYLLESCSLHYSNSADRDQLFSLPIQTETAYVLSKKEKIYFIRLKGVQVVCVEDCLTNLQDYFPKEDKPKPITDSAVTQMVVLHLTQPASKLHHPRYIKNEKNATYLHEAVLLQRAEMVQILLADGANTDLRATYRIFPDNQCIEVTAQELASYLNYSALEEVFTNHSMSISPGNKSF
ncbi:hypothetical protein [Legionella maioricensis]|uniref:Ankyrin repeat-containing protein n=1 Tax=Legionella maioricensis TaxID=2896528 RepID=A0A9X2IBK1_9GAMM|nr:hypothetical protein [Legionella maioricensis]MCL9684321.1 hypothetical protein [Legionella maioricensis]MCL9687187.1 hypothetical protein [Legionella maioricensis]